MKSLGDIRRNNPQTGFSIVEVVVSALVFSLAAAGVFATVSALRRPAENSTREVTAAYVGKRILDELRTKVDQDTWTTGDLQLGVRNETLIVNGISYTLTYNIAADPGGTNARKVTLNLAW